MKQDKNTLQSILDKLSSQEQMIRSGIGQKIQAIEKMQQEAEQQKGALAYNIMLADEIRGQLKELAANEGPNS